MGDYLYKDHEGPSLDHPDAAIRLASVVHRFRVPKMSERSLSFVKSFGTVGKHPQTRKLMNNADDCRRRLEAATTAPKISSARVVADAERYTPLIHNILVSCKVQPEGARLDHKLIFEWMSGIEQQPQALSFSSEAIMYDLTMSIACEGFGHAAAATEHSVAGDFAAASREYAKAAGIMDFLAKEHLPKWVSKGANVQPGKLPSECHVAAMQAFASLFQANGQQMAVATLLMKPGEPNYGLVAKLCLGIADQLEEFTSILRREAFEAQSRIDKDFFTLVTFQVGIQQGLSLHFQGRAAWKKDDYGVAIALMSEATVALRTRDHPGAKGLPDISKTPALTPLKADLQALRKHFQQILHTWEKDNSSVYFDGVPQHLPAEKKLQEGHCMRRSEAFQLEDPEPVLLVLPEGTTEQSDEDLARELQERLNAGADA